MGRRPALTPPRKLTTHLPADLMVKLDLILLSEVDAKVPFNAYGKFFSERLREFFDWKRVSLEPYGFPQGFFITGPLEMMEAVEERLKGEVK